MNQNKMGFWSITLLGINGIIGSGIFLLPGQIMALTGYWSFVVYLFVALISFAVAWCFTKCAVLFQRNGGSYLYAKEAFGDFVGFEIGLMRWMVGIIAWASLTVGFVTALSMIWPIVLLEPFRTAIILSMLGILGLFNILGIQVVKYISNVLTIAKLIPLMLLILIGVFYVKSPFLFPAEIEPFPLHTFGASSLMLFYAFSGFESLATAAGEIKNPSRTLPWAVFTAITICTVIYFCIQFISTGILGPALATSTAPIVDVAEHIFGAAGKWIILLATLVSIGGINLVASFIIPIGGVVLAEDRMIPSIIAKRNKFGTPHFAILISVGMTALVALSGEFTQLVIISVISRFAQYISTCLATFVFYRQQLSAGKIFIPLMALTGICWLLLQTQPMQLAWGLGALALMVPFYFVRRYAMSKSHLERDNWEKGHIAKSS